MAHAAHTMPDDGTAQVCEHCHGAGEYLTAEGPMPPLLIERHRCVACRGRGWYYLGWGPR